MTLGTPAVNGHGGALDWCEKMVVGALMARAFDVAHTGRRKCHICLDPVSPYSIKKGAKRQRVGNGATRHTVGSSDKRLVNDNDVTSEEPTLNKKRAFNITSMSILSVANSERATDFSRSILETAFQLKNDEFLGSAVSPSSLALSLIYKSFIYELKSAGLDKTIFISEPASPA